ncbi:hypothetical protein BD324DRAFT_612195 [Kockovaella imperatae]|uniref:Mid2 domain-containing protein n=1 Tax=Kockovaella imperatae TaxID=4999 RepID=A0A1Y1US15_9TREE|nr:hypothetical protein BD324DRAFT_612195 [Kockovaella imperatae]ORX40820.1 hypothetical protein BD324DRAFT_612195 [Kockovaella imperatae]
MLSDSGRAVLTLILTASVNAALPPDTPWHARQDANTETLVPTITVQSAVASSSDIVSTSRLVPIATPIPLADKMGLIMPDPWHPVYAGLNYSFGFVDPTPKPAPTIGGWIRQIQPLLILPNYRVNIFPSSGQSNPEVASAVPLGSDGLCGATVINYATSYPFVFQESGWYMFVINQTWLQPTISENTCRKPLISEKSFFAWQSLSVAPLPTSTPLPSPSTRTIYNNVVTNTPGQLPFERTVETDRHKLAIGIGVTVAVLALIGMGAVIYFAQRRAKMRRESLAFSRLSERDKQDFLAENPDSWLNPNRNIRQNRGGPPAPPGTWAYENWYWQQMWNRQHAPWRWGGQSSGAGAEPAHLQPMTMVQHGYPTYQGYHGGYQYNGVPQQPVYR